ncbi:hypothetical protein ES703_125539 [subsurface metagenome]
MSLQPEDNSFSTALRDQMARITFSNLIGEYLTHSTMKTSPGRLMASMPQSDIWKAATHSEATWQLPTLATGQALLL